MGEGISKIEKLLNQQQTQWRKCSHILLCPKGILKLTKTSARRTTTLCTRTFKTSGDPYNARWKPYALLEMGMNHTHKTYNI